MIYIIKCDECNRLGFICTVCHVEWNQAARRRFGKLPVNFRSSQHKRRQSPPAKQVEVFEQPFTPPYMMFDERHELIERGEA